MCVGSDWPFGMQASLGVGSLPTEPGPQLSSAVKPSQDADEPKLACRGVAFAEYDRPLSTSGLLMLHTAFAS